MRIILRNDRHVSSGLGRFFNCYSPTPHLLALFDGFTVVGGMAHDQENGYDAGD